MRLLLVLLVIATAQAQANDDLAQLAWLAGHWQTGHGDQRQSETWILASPTLLLGHNVTVRGDRSVFEFLRIEQRGADVIYTAAPGGAASTEFKLVDSGDHYAVFANPQHDFPKQIEYRCEGEQITATISDGGAKKILFQWQRQRVIPDRIQ